MGILVDRPKKVVAYYRHSREHAQENSIPIQRDRVRRFAIENRLDIIHEEKDEGESGLTANRPGFQSLLHHWVLNPNRSNLFEGIIFLDVSRMGRFQDLDEFGHYTYIFRQHGKWVWFIDHGSLPAQTDPMQHLIIAMKRAAAADHSAKLSDRVWHGSVKISAEGFSAGGLPGYGLERVLLDERRRMLQVLPPGQQKRISNQRVTFRPARDATAKTVTKIFNLFKELGSPRLLAQILNGQNIPSPGGKLWSTATVLRVLRNEAYIGTRIYNKTWQRLHNPRRHNPKSEWIVCPGAWDPLIAPKEYFRVQQKLRQILPTARFRGPRLIRQVEQELMNEILEVLHFRTGKHKLASQPILYSLRHDSPAGRSWQFTISESNRSYDTVLGIGLCYDQGSAVEYFFEFPTDAFGRHNVLSFSEHDAGFKDYLRTRADIQNRLAPDLVKIKKF